MCAICGIIHFDGQPVAQSVLIQMRDVMANRGPDFGGMHLDGPVGLGHRRLKIIDLSANANQPLPNEDRSVWVVSNGEVYNFQELRKELETLGHRFQSGSDTEVIVHGYEAWGDGVVSRLDGMFAFGLWDGQAGRLVLARDRFGKKPLYYLAQGETVAFASDIKALRLLPFARLTLNPAAIDCYLHHLGVTQDQCIYSEVRKVKPAHYEVFTRADRRAERYWHPEFGRKIHAGEDEWLERVEAALKAAVRKRLVSDVPLGAFLSGGVDSSLVVALMSQAASRPVKTFSIGFAEQDFSELEYSRQVVRRYRTEHQEIMLEPDVLGVLPALVWEYGEPFADSSAIPTFYVSQAARQHVTVALSGDGGDELFGGYDIARVAWLAERYYCRLPGFIRRCLERLLASPAAARSSWLRKARTLTQRAHPDPAVRFDYSLAFGSSHKATLYTPEFQAQMAAQPSRAVIAAWQAEAALLSLVDQHLFMTIMTRLPNDYLVKADVAAMKVALEVRSPFLDTALAELASTIPAEIKVRGGRQKYLLKKLAECYLPREIIYRSKRGFSLPLKHWLRRDFAPLASDLLLQGELARTGWFRPEAFRQLLAEHTGGTADHTHRLWALVWLELWHRMFVSQTLQASDRLK